MECPRCDGNGNVCDFCDENPMNGLRRCDVCKKEFCSIPPWLAGKFGPEYDCFQDHNCQVPPSA